jgi:hypothetical protein
LVQNIEGTSRRSGTDAFFAWLKILRKQTGSFNGNVAGGFLTSGVRPRTDFNAVESDGFRELDRCRFGGVAKIPIRHAELELV